MKEVIAFDEMTYQDNEDYKLFLESIKYSFRNTLKMGHNHLFTTDANGLYDTFLDCLPAESRQIYNCNACRHFVNKFGGLVVIDENTGEQTPAMWNTNMNMEESVFHKAALRLCDKVKRSKVTGVFVTSGKTLGTPATGCWIHMATRVPDEAIYRSRIKTPHQVMTEKAEERRTLCRAIQVYSTETAAEAVNLLRSDSMYRGDKALGMAEWFLSVLHAIAGKGKKTHNIIWYKVAAAPSGFCHIPASTVGALMEDIDSGLPLEEIRRRFAEKMDPLKYQRPQAVPGAGNVARAKEIVEKLGIATSLKRRFARLEELQTIWLPAHDDRDAAHATGVFAGVETKKSAKKKRAVKSQYIPTETVTWAKFRRKVLDRAKQIEFLVSGRRENFAAILTAEDPESPPIIQWDTEQKRNPFSWYVYAGGSLPSRWNLNAYIVKITGIILKPSLWQPGFEHHGQGVIFILEGAKDSNYQNCGNGLFPEILKSELREVRATIEAYSRKQSIGGYNEASACGLMIGPDGSFNTNPTFRVTTDEGITNYQIDRWE